MIDNKELMNRIIAFKELQNELKELQEELKNLQEIEKTHKEYFKSLNEQQFVFEKDGKVISLKISNNRFTFKEIESNND